MNNADVVAAIAAVEAYTKTSGTDQAAALKVALEKIPGLWIHCDGMRWRFDPGSKTIEIEASQE